MFKALHLVALLLAAWLSADTVDAVLSIHWQAPRGAADPALSPPLVADRSLDRFLGPIRGRNVFRHGEAVPDEEPIPAPAAAPAPEACTLPVKLLSALIVPDAPQRSLGVLLEDRAPHEALQVVEVGETLEHLGTVLAVWEVLSEDNLRLVPVVELRTPEGRVESCRGDSAGAVLAPAPALPAAAGVRRLSDTRMEVDRKLVDQLLNGGLEVIARQVLVAPWIVDGRPVGFRFQRIQAGSLPAQIGLLEGDVVGRINGYPMTTVEEALRAYTSLRNESQITVDLTRNGAPVTLSYAIR